VGEGTLQRSPEESHREIALRYHRRKNLFSDLARICISVAFALFIIGFATVATPVTTAAICWILALVFFIGAIVLTAVNHFS
jgi:uncharacterized membrane protein (DUF485 family)